MSEKIYRILIVEDHRELARMLRTAIDGLGETFTAVDTPSGEEALLEARHHDIDLAIVDLRLPGMNGVEVVRRLRERRPDIKIFLISGQESSKIRQLAQEIHADGWFRKPLELADLLDALERSLGLVTSILGAAPTTIVNRKEEEKVVGRMSDQLADLREALQARAVLLLDDMGHVVLQAGTIDEKTLPQKALLTLLSLHATSAKLALAMHSAPRYHFYFHFQECLLHFSAISPQYALLVVCSPPCQHVSFDALAQHLYTTVERLRAQMERLGILDTSLADREILTEAARSEEEIPPDGDELLTLLEQALPTDEAEDFWETLVREDLAGEAINPDALTYEQARQLGLTPAEE